MQDPVTSLIVTLFAAPGAALVLSGAILAFAIGLIIFSRVREYGLLRQEINDRWNLLTGLRGSGAKAKQQFFEKFPAVDQRFSHVLSNDPVSVGLVLGWANYRSLLTDTGEGQFAISVRAQDVFEPLDEPARTLEWWANILVAIGLAITFMGIVAALSETTSSMQSGDAAAMQSAIVGLLAIAATKFWTSIAGVVASIILRLVARQRRKRILALEAMFYEALDACVNFMPTEKVLIEHLRALGRIEAVLERQAEQG
ncbi:MAG: hypothetical protein QM645_10140 [Asticcacaulis sp.]